MNTDHTIVTVASRGIRIDLTAIAERFITRELDRDGYVALKCECGEGDVTIDRLASLTADGRELVALLEHALFDHVSPHRIEETRVSRDLSVADFELGDFGVEPAPSIADALEAARDARLDAGFEPASDTLRLPALDAAIAAARAVGFEAFDEPEERGAYLRDDEL